MKDWKKAIIVASGPSLTKEDCDKLKDTGWKIIAVNNSWELVPFADVVFACDVTWWNVHIEKVRQEFKGECWTTSKRARELHNINLILSEDNPGLNTNKRVNLGGNSGYQAVNLAYTFGARTIFMLGLDCKPAEDGKAHWFGQHGKGLSQKQNYSKWKDRFPKLAKDLEKYNAKAYNLSRDTALTCFERMSLEEAIDKFKGQ
jgi:hypothetical protein